MFVPHRSKNVDYFYFHRDGRNRLSARILVATIGGLRSLQFAISLRCTRWNTGNEQQTQSPSRTGRYRKILIHSKAKRCSTSVRAQTLQDGCDQQSKSL